MDLETLTSGRYIRLGLCALDKEAAIGQLLDCLVEEGVLPGDAREELFETVMRRERRLSTGLEAGIALPHGTTARLAHEVAALGVFPDGVPFETLDGGMPRIVILLVTPESQRHRHVTNLAALARQLLHPEVRDALLRAHTREEAAAAIRLHLKG